MTAFWPLFVSESTMEFKEISESDAQTIYHLEKVIWMGTTSKGVLVSIGDSAEYGRMLFMGGELQSASNDERFYHETLVHPAMQRAVANHHVHYTEGLRVLVVGGGEGATVREVLRWPQVSHVDWVDWDEEAVNICRQHLQWAGPETWLDSRLNTYWDDIQVVLPRLEGQYDCIVLDLPDPDGNTGWLYSAEFWTALKGRLSATGVMVTHCGPVRPWGNIGEGFQRVRNALGDDKIGGFYHTLIPSFQGEWGFWLIDAGDATSTITCAPIPMPVDLLVADREQIAHWFHPTAVWRRAVATALLPSQ